MLTSQEIRTCCENNIENYNSGAWQTSNKNSLELLTDIYGVLSPSVEAVKFFENLLALKSLMEIQQAKTLPFEIQKSLTNYILALPECDIGLLNKGALPREEMVASHVHKTIMLIASLPALKRLELIAKEKHLLEKTTLTPKVNIKNVLRKI